MKRLIPLLCLALVANTYALEDTPENRAKEAARCLAAISSEEMLADIVASMIQTFPNAAPQFRKTMTKHLDMVAIKEAVKQSTIKTFTADELKALADLYGTRDGKSAMRKMIPYMTDLMPAIQSQFMQAMEKANAAPSAYAPTP